MRLAIGYDRDTFATEGWTVAREVLPRDTRAALAEWADDISVLPGHGAQRLHYFEQTSAGRALCRTERFLEDHPALAELMTQGTLPLMAAELLGEPVVLYKEKMNHKAAGGAGFAPHQDATAYAFVKRHITCLVAIDAMTVENGCLEFSPYGGCELLPQDGDGCIDPSVAQALPWRPVELSAGDVLLFTSHVPHRSGPNRSGSARRALYLTYNAASEGDRRAAYYRERARAIDSAAGSANARISTIGHFQGRPAS